MPQNPTRPAIVLANGCFRDIHAKTAHGLVRGSARYEVRGVVDPSCAGGDAGEVLDGRVRGIPLVASLAQALSLPGPPAEVCVVGVATEGGVLPPELRGELLAAADAGLTLVNGLHQLLAGDAALVARVASAGGQIVDLRRPRPFEELRFWTGEVLGLEIPRVAVLGTDCALGKRTTAQLLLEALRERGRRAELIYTGQTGWLQGLPYGFILDATANDFVCGELEGAILACARERSPELILLEGQSALRNPSGPCGAELLLSAGARTVVLQHAPARAHYDGLGDLALPIPPLAEELELIRLHGARVAALALNQEGLDAARAEACRAQLERELGLPVVLPLRDGVGAAVEAVLACAGLGSGA